MIALLHVVRIEKSCAKKAWGLGRDVVVEPVRSCTVNDRLSAATRISASPLPKII